MQKHTVYVSYFSRIVYVIHGAKAGGYIKPAVKALWMPVGALYCLVSPQTN